MMTIPNMLTLFRIGLIPVMVVLFYLPFEWTRLATAIIFATASFTDLFDGYIARSTGQITDLGTFLDPVADKLMVAVALSMLVESYATVWLTIPAIVIICR
ncbi:MAG: CDP-diacylglycerol--glycerol-3-phosphate 3-phosphatidyltransferase, partial [Gammaproteobacteria bacterium]|nr:CDP-diacylglycerol--glycerol-3-phosphate 3-phosphatidyltransferase [Gammaproteobacteria bacterium]